MEWPDDGQLRIVKVEARPTSNPNVKDFDIILSDGRTWTTRNPQLSGLAEALARDGDVIDEPETTGSGKTLKSLRKKTREIPQNPLPPITADEIAF